MNKIIGMILIAALMSCFTSTASAAEIMETEVIAQETVLQTETFPAENQETISVTEISAENTEEDEWLYTLTDNLEGTETILQIKNEPTKNSFIQFTLENRLEMLLVSMVFVVFGIGTCWVGHKLGGTKFLLRFRGIRTTGTLSHIKWDAWNRAYRYTMTYHLENGKIIISEWPVLQHCLRPEKKLGKTYTIYYNPDKPKEFYCGGFVKGKELGSLSVLIGMLLILVALAILFSVMISLFI